MFCEIHAGTWRLVIKPLISQYQKYHNTLCFVPPQFCVSIVFISSWDLQRCQEKLETMLVQKFGGTNKAYYGSFDTGKLLVKTPMRTNLNSVLDKKKSTPSRINFHLKLGLVRATDRRFHETPIKAR